MTVFLLEEPLGYSLRELILHALPGLPKSSLPKCHTRGSHVEAHPRNAGGGGSVKTVPSPVVSKVKVLHPISCVYSLWQVFSSSLLEKVLSC